MVEKGRRVNIFERHPMMTVSLVVIFALTLIALGAEIFLRMYVHYNPGYYTGFENISKGVKTYPYGIIPTNSDNFPDKEFTPEKNLPRVAYVGDSVSYGVGAGYGYRISELLEKQYPALEHMNMAFGVGKGVSLKNIDKIEQWAELYELDRIVYLMNLNDILPDDTESVGEVGVLAPIARIERMIGILRGKSYLYTHIRFKIKIAFNRWGYQAGGFKRYEFFIDDNMNLLEQTVKRIAVLDERLGKAGVDFVVVILPYEMQISSEAEEKYRSLGINWDESFIGRGPQKHIAERFDELGIHYVDAYYSFVTPGEVEKSRAANPLGYYFVYDRGDKLDWNHPNRKGHEVIASYIGNRLSSWFLGPAP